MIIYRFMSEREFDDFNSGKVLINNEVHQSRTTSKGFCFLNKEDYEPEYAYHFLGGIVSDYVCAVFNVLDGNILNKGEGIFADPGGSFFQTIQVDEYWTNTYSNKQLELIEYKFDADYTNDFYDEWSDWITESDTIKTLKNLANKNRLISTKELEELIEELERI